MPVIGILNVDKPAGWSSRDVVNRVERLVQPAKAGHAGTLDPLATGVLVICVGQATRLIQYVQRKRKRYRATFLFGRRSDSDDIEGDVCVLADAPVATRGAIEKVLPRFLGEIHQRPPAYSALKVAGRRAYELARRGVAVELGSRAVVVYGLSIVRFEYPELELDIECGSGMYVRALGRDLAESLGTAAVMAELRRTAIGGYRVEDAVPIDVLSTKTLAEHLQSPLTAVADLPRATLSDAELVEIRHGRPIAMPGSGPGGPTVEDADWAATNSAGELVAILREKHAGELWPTHNFGDRF